LLRSAAGELRPPAFRLGLRLWGLDCSLAFTAAEPLPESPTRLWLAVGAGYEDAALYRSFAGSDTVGVRTDTPVSEHTAVYKTLDLDAALGASQDLAVGSHIFSAFLVGTFRYERHDPAWAPDALIFDSSLPDRTGLLEDGVLLGLSLRRRVAAASALTTIPIEYRIEASLRAAPSFLGNRVADYLRLSTTGILVYQLVNARSLELYLAWRLGYDAMWGSSFPVHARTSMGGIGSPFFTLEPGLGGALRGIAEGRFDGTAKLYQNLDLRFRFPISPYFVPAATLFFDCGVSDYRGLDHTIEASDILYSAGVNLTANVARNAQIGYVLSYAWNEPDPERRFSYGVTLEAHF
jgi:hypothetical protein